MILPIDKDLIPYQFEIELEGELFTFVVDYNFQFDFFTIDCLKNEKPLVYGEKLILNRPLFAGLTNIELPKITITPKDRAGIEKRITFDNLSETVFLYAGE
ncbi:phage baseplate plug protein [Heyndrickxia oleronia]|uniref:phage baseplate plug family protein n=1 Tax=Heyndrickxia oleronia TaxID=38875 RepID=UPI001C0F03D3|nr:hypothetical protein [Heyndrickxia oleronia]MBU5214351.1 hypothetical protein [Heyndrickxia oleronia]